MANADKSPMMSVTLRVLFCSILAASGTALADGKNDHVLIINGGGSRNSNNQRYFENVKAMYEGFRANKVPAERISVLYGSGDVADTRTKESEPKLVNYGSYSGQYGGSYRSQNTAALSPQNLTQLKAAIKKSIRQNSKSLYGGESNTVPPGEMGYTGGGMIPYGSSPSTYGNPSFGYGIPSTESNGGTPSNSPETLSTSNITLESLFNGEKRELDGPGTPEAIKDQLRKLRGKLGPKDQLTIYITDHGSKENEDETSIVLWGSEEMTVSELGDLLREFPSSTQINIVTNICYGGGLTELTSSNICVYASQVESKPNQSESLDLNLYGQNFPFAMKKKIDTDNDGKLTFMDAHLYAESLDNPSNTPQTSLDWFLAKNKNKILEQKQKKKRSEEQCSVANHPDSAIAQIASLIEDFERVRPKVDLTTDKIPMGRRRYLNGRLEKALAPLQAGNASTVVQNFDFRFQDLKTSLEESAKNWKSLTPAQQNEQRQQAQLMAQQIESQMNNIGKDLKKFEKTSLELDLLKYGDDNLLEEYANIRKCLEYAY